MPYHTLSVFNLLIQEGVISVVRVMCISILRQLISTQTHTDTPWIDVLFLSLGSLFWCVTPPHTHTHTHTRTQGTCATLLGNGIVLSPCRQITTEEGELIKLLWDFLFNQEVAPTCKGTARTTFLPF